MNPDQPWRIEIGPREIYDVVMALKAEQASIHRDIKEIQKHQEDNRREREALQKQVNDMQDAVDKMKIRVYGAVIGLAVSAGALIRGVTM